MPSGQSFHGVPILLGVSAVDDCSADVNGLQLCCDLFPIRSEFLELIVAVGVVEHRQGNQLAGGGTGGMGTSKAAQAARKSSISRDFTTPSRAMMAHAAATTRCLIGGAAKANRSNA